MENILIIENHKTTAKLLSKVTELSDNIKNCRIVETSDEALELLKNEKFTILIIDLNQVNLYEINTLKEIKMIDDELKILILSSEYHTSLVLKAIELGVNGFLSKSVSLNDVASAIHTLSEGGTYFDKNSLKIIIENTVNYPQTLNKEFRHYSKNAYL